MTFYSGLAATANRLLAKYGRAVVLSRPSASDATYDPATGVATAVDAATYSGVGAVFDYTAREMDGTSVRAGDRRVLLSPAGMVMPRAGDRIEIGGVALVVVTGREINPASTAVMFEAQVRGVS